MPSQNKYVDFKLNLPIFFQFQMIWLTSGLPDVCAISKVVTGMISSPSTLTVGFGPGPGSRWPPPTVPPQAGPTNPGPIPDTRPNSITGSKLPNPIMLNLKSMDPWKPVW